MGTSINLETSQHMSKLDRNFPVDIEFQDLNYLIQGGGGKQILKSISGKFYSGELTAILGASGSGKTTLLNILAGYITKGVTGSILVNGRPRNMKMFHKMSAYIMQEDLLQPHLTVKELMITAAKLKLGDSVMVETKLATVSRVLKLLGLEDCMETRSECISGGQRKRLAIALEMVSNPPVLFLDEPTSGLDIVAINQCIEVLKSLTGQGRTVICTIHQPSVSVFQAFKQVYFIQDGMCIYNGCALNVLPFMSSLGYQCPITYSPADHIIEVAQSITESVPVLVSSIQNGKLNKRDLKECHTARSFLGKSSIYKGTTYVQQTEAAFDFQTTFWTQFALLFSRMMLQMSRNKLMIWIQLFHHAFSGVLFGLLFYGVGSNGSYTLSSFKYCTAVIIFFVYTYLMSSVLIFPSEIQLLKREYFNRWYGLKPYFLALSLRSLPLQLVVGIMFILITYLLTDQPLEIDRFVLFAIPSILVGMASEGLGIAIGSIFNITNGSIVAPAIAAPMVIFCIYGIGYGSTISSIMKICMYTSYLRVALIAVAKAVFGGRQSLPCTEEIYCHYQDPKRMLRDLGMLNGSYAAHILGLLAYVLAFRVIAFLAIRYRLTSNLSMIVTNYVSKIFRYRQC